MLPFGTQCNLWEETRQRIFHVQYFVLPWKIFVWGALSSSFSRWLIFKRRRIMNSPCDSQGSRLQTIDDSRHVPTILIFWSVENTERCVSLACNNMDILAGFPNVFFAISHFDANMDLWQAQRWYDSPRIVYRSCERGTKIHQWKKLLPAIIETYDYVWLCDCDLGFEKFDISILNQVLSLAEVWYCQPSIVGKTPDTHSTDIVHLRYDPKKPIVEWICNRSEVQSPILNTKAWRIVHEQICLMDDRSDWGIDGFWDELFNHSNRPFPLIHSPLVHYNFRNVEVNGAIRGWAPTPFVHIDNKHVRMGQFRDEHGLHPRI